jgi:predicted CXXCH cytochrome family protein
MPMSRLSLATLLALALAGSFSAAAASLPGYAGTAACAQCHEPQTRLWRGSHHDLAMTEATEETVLGDFADASITAHGVTSTFFRRDGGYFVRTDGPEGALAEFPIRYTFGWTPLQQYLVPLPGGRLQALGLAWDSRPREAGGQRWFHLYPHEADMDHRHPLHWTARDQTWNYQCAECHSTGLDKGYDLGSDTYATKWAEVDVACEACHGPATAHVAQARKAFTDGEGAWDATRGLVVDLTTRDGGIWSIDPQTGIPARSVPRTDRTEQETCARCHSRRGQIHADYVHGRPLADTHRLSLLEARLYHADGQILDEVFVHGSFLQSRMRAAGVTCSDCHDPHSLRLRADGNRVCARCHEAGRYDHPTHHHHETGTPGAACVACHMPQRFYMVVDERADHSLRVPRPDLSLSIGTPNPCNGCHADKDAGWAADAIAAWAGPDYRPPPHYGEVLHAGRTGAADAAEALIGLAVDTTAPPIARASALDLLGERIEPGELTSLPRLLSDPEPLLRAAAARRLAHADGQVRLQLGLPLLRDPMRLVRIDAARALAALLRYPIPGDQRAAIRAGVEEYRAAQRVNADRPEAHLNLGLVETEAGDAGAAQAAYRTALRLDPAFGPAYVNLSDLYRMTGQDAEGLALLTQAAQALPANADLHHALGLALVRGGRRAEAVTALGRAAKLAPERPYLSYVHALALKETGDVDQALAVLEAARRSHPTDRDLLIGLATIHRDAGNQEAALQYAQELARAHPQDRGAAGLLRALRQD